MCSCSVDSLNKTEVNGSIVLCYAPSDIVSMNPRSDLVTIVNDVIAANGAGVIYAQYTTNILYVLEGCNGFLTCAVVDFEIANQILNYYQTRYELFPLFHQLFHQCIKKFLFGRAAINKLNFKNGSEICFNDGR